MSCCNNILGLPMNNNNNNFGKERQDVMIGCLMTLHVVEANRNWLIQLSLNSTVTPIENATK